MKSRITEIDVPSVPPRGTEVLLRVVPSEVCHMDTHLRTGGYDLGGRGRLNLVDRGVAYPLVMGHEVVGEVVAGGEAVNGVKVGHTRLVYPWLGCGDCPACVDDRENACAVGRNLGVARPGGYADHLLVPHPRYLIDVEGLDLGWAATLACSGLTAYSAARKVLPLPRTGRWS